MKKVILLTVILFSVFLISSYSFEPATLVWETNFSSAVQKAKKEKKALLVNFTGSDWCGWCKKLDKEVFSQQKFIDYADQKLVCVKIDFPRAVKQTKEEKAQNQALAQKYRVEGLPSILLMDTNEKVLLQTGYQYGGVDNYINHLEPYIAKK